MLATVFIKLNYC